MKDFALQHPWMLFWLVVLMYVLIDNMWSNWCNRNKPPQPICKCEQEE